MKIIASHKDLPEGFTLDQYPAVYNPKTNTYYSLGRVITLKEIEGYESKIPNCSSNVYHTEAILKFIRKILGDHYPDIKNHFKTSYYLKGFIDEYPNLIPFRNFIYDNDVSFNYFPRGNWHASSSTMSVYIDVDGLDMQDRYTVEREVKVTNFNDSKVKVNDRCWIKSERGALRAIGVVKGIKETSLVLKIEYMGTATRITRARLFPIISSFNKESND